MTTEKKKQYAKRDHMMLDERGGYYARHVEAMTAEGLHSKSEIAGELAHRDLEIDQLRRSVTFYEQRCDAIAAIQRCMRDPERKAVCDILANGSTEVFKGKSKP